MPPFEPIVFKQKEQPKKEKQEFDKNNSKQLMDIKASIIMLEDILEYKLSKLNNK